MIYTGSRRIAGRSTQPSSPA